MKCHWSTAEDGVRFWLPGCWGGAVNGPYDCHCRPSRPPKQPDPKDVLIKELEQDNARLHRMVRNILKSKR